MAQEEVILQITEVTEAQDTNGNPYKKVKAGGKTYSAFPETDKAPTPGYDLIKPGAVLDCTIRIGKYKNIIKAKTHEGAVPQEVSQQSNSGGSWKGKSKEELDINAAQTALKEAVHFAEICVSHATPLGGIAIAVSGKPSGMMSENDVCYIAVKFLEFIKTGQVSPKTETPRVEPPKAKVEGNGKPVITALTKEQFVAKVQAAYPLTKKIV